MYIYSRSKLKTAKRSPANSSKLAPKVAAKPVTKVTGFFRLRQRRKLAFESWRERKKTEANEVCF